jgi:hypothetical protein
MVKVARLLGSLAALGTLSLYIVLVFFNPYSPGSLTIPIMLMMLLSGVSTITAWKAKPYLMLVIFLLSFVPMGLYMLGTPGLFKWIGIFNLLFLLASVLMVAEPVVIKLQRKTKSF